MTNSLQNGRTSELEGIFQSAESLDQWVVAKALFSGPLEKLNINDVEFQTFVGTITPTNGSMTLDFASLSKLGFWQLGALLLAALSLCTCLAAFVVCLMTRQLRRKWLWAIFTLIGICPVSLDVATGKAVMEPIAAVLLGGGISPYVTKFGLALFPFEPMSGQLIVFSIPLGALIFFYRTARNEFT